MNGRRAREPFGDVLLIFTAAIASLRFGVGVFHLADGNWREALGSFATALAMASICFLMCYVNILTARLSKRGGDVGVHVDPARIREALLQLKRRGDGAA